MKAADIWDIRPTANEKAVIRGKSYRITVLTDRLIRMEYEENGNFRDTATQTVLCRDFPVPAFRVTETERGLTVETEGLILRYDRERFSSAGLSVSLKGAYAAYGSVWHYGDNVRTFGGTARTLDEADGEIPLEDGLTSPQGYAVLDDSRSMGLDGEGRLTPARPRGEDLYLFAYGRDFQGCIRDYLRLSGPVPAVPRFALGNWWSRYYPYTQEEYQTLMERFRSEGIPLSVSVLDMNWHVTEINPKFGTGWTGYTWDREKFPEPEKLLAWLHGRGLKVTLNDHPADGVRPCESMHSAMAKALGDDPAEGKSYPYDAADPRYEAAFEKTVLEPLEDEGVDFWWIDWQQKGGSSDPGMDPLFTLNHTRYLHALEKGGPALILSRYGGPGSHRYPLGFSGDTFVTWASLAFQPRFTATAANIAYSWWSHDIGGHMHGAWDPELTTRWVQFGVFSPVMRLHSSNSRFMEKEPWKFPMEEREIMTRFLRLRHQLVPWLYTRNLICSRENRMMLRPMYYDSPWEREAYEAGRFQYLLGDCVTVSPVTRPMNPASQLGEAETWLPEGVWTDFFTGWRYKGGRKRKMFRPLDSIPVLVRAGGILPMDGDEIPADGAPLPKNVVLRVFPGADGETELIEDNGLMPADPLYRQVRTVIRMSGGNGLRLEILPPEGETALIPANRRYTLELNGAADVPPDSCSCGYTAEYHPEIRALRLRLDAEAETGTEIRWDGEISPPALDRTETLEAMLRRARIEFDLKEKIMRIANQVSDPAALLAEIHPAGLPESLYGAVLELMSAE